MSKPLNVGDKISWVRRKFLAGLLANATNVTVQRPISSEKINPAPIDELRQMFVVMQPAVYWLGGIRYRATVHPNCQYEFDAFAPDSATALKYGPKIHVAKQEK